MSTPTPKRTRKNRWQKTLDRVQSMLVQAGEARVGIYHHDPAANSAAELAVMRHFMDSALREIETCNAGEDEVEEGEGGGE